MLVLCESLQRPRRRDKRQFQSATMTLTERKLHARAMYGTPSSVWSARRRPPRISSLDLGYDRGDYLQNSRVKTEISSGSLLEEFFTRGTLNLPDLAVWLCSVLFAGQCKSRLLLRLSHQFPFLPRAFTFASVFTTTEFAESSLASFGTRWSV